jgi:hypothetical protein
VIQQSSLSLQYVPVQITVQVGVPTGDTVQFAFTTGGADPQAGDWKTASWATNITGLPNGVYIAQCLVGPGGAVQLAAGTYQIWVKITDNPEVPVLKGGTLQIY